MAKPATFDRAQQVGIFLRCNDLYAAITKMVATLRSRKWAQGVRPFSPQVSRKLG